MLDPGSKRSRIHINDGSVGLFLSSRFFVVKCNKYRLLERSAKDLDLLSSFLCGSEFLYNILMEQVLVTLMECPKLDFLGRFTSGS